MTKSIFCLFFLASANLASAQLRIEISDKHHRKQADYYNYNVYESQGTETTDDDVFLGDGVAVTVKNLGLKGVSATAKAHAIKDTPRGCTIYSVSIINQEGDHVASGAWATDDCYPNSSSN